MTAVGLLVLATCVGLVVYVFAQGKASEVGRIVAMCGILWLMYLIGQGRLRP